jgi:hypothetical protein
MTGGDPVHNLAPHKQAIYASSGGLVDLHEASDRRDEPVVAAHRC